MVKIIFKDYDEKERLRVVRPKNGKIPGCPIRFKILKNGKEFPCCDWYGTCTNKAYVEVYPSLMKNSKKKGWNYLCKKHYLSEQKRFNGKLPACLKVEW